LETHVSDCFCVFCVSRVSNWAMALELDRLTLLFRRNTPTQFQLFKDTLYNNYIHKVILKIKIIVIFVGSITASNFANKFS